MSKLLAAILQQASRSTMRNKSPQVVRTWASSRRDVPNQMGNTLIGRSYSSLPGSSKLEDEIRQARSLFRLPSTIDMGQSQILQDLDILTMLRFNSGLLNPVTSYQGVSSKSFDPEGSIFEEGYGPRPNIKYLPSQVLLSESLMKDYKENSAGFPLAGLSGSATAGSFAGQWGSVNKVNVLAAEPIVSFDDPSASLTESIRNRVLGAYVAKEFEKVTFSRVYPSQIEETMPTDMFGKFPDWRASQKDKIVNPGYLPLIVPSPEMFDESLDELLKEAWDLAEDEDYQGALEVFHEVMRKLGKSDFSPAIPPYSLAGYT